MTSFEQPNEKLQLGTAVIDATTFQGQILEQHLYHFWH